MISCAENGTFVQDREIDIAVPSQQTSGLEFKLEMEVIEAEERVDAVKSKPDQRIKLVTDIERERQKQSEYNVMFSKLAWDRWNDLKENLSVNTHSGLALLLIDCWYVFR